MTWYIFVIQAKIFYHPIYIYQDLCYNRFAFPNTPRTASITAVGFFQKMGYSYINQTAELDDEQIYRMGNSDNFRLKIKVKLR